MEAVYRGNGLGGAACMGGSGGADVDVDVDTGAGAGTGSTGAVVTVGDGTDG